MKRTFIFSAGFLCSLYVLLASNASGPASSSNGIRNGGPNSIGTCSACHSGGTGTTTATLSLKEKASGATVTGSYKPGIVYIVTISGNNANLAFFGFQVTATTAANQQAGSFSNLGADKHATPISGLQVVEHSTTLAKTNGAYTASFDWTAPSAGAGTVSLHGIINGVNKNNQTDGDRSSAPTSLSLTEDAGATAIHDPSAAPSFELYPNPASDLLYVRMPKGTAGNYRLSVLDLNGKELWHGAAATGTAAITVPVKALASGAYFLRISGKDYHANRMFRKD